MKFIELSDQSLKSVNQSWVGALAKYKSSSCKYKRLEIVVVLEGVVEPSGNTTQVFILKDLLQKIHLFVLFALSLLYGLNTGENLVPARGDHVGPPLQKLCQFCQEWGIQFNSSIFIVLPDIFNLILLHRVCLLSTSLVCQAWLRTPPRVSLRPSSKQEKRR